MLRTNSINHLCSIMSAREQVVRSTAHGDFDDLETWVSLGVLQPAGHVANAICTECGVPHFVDVENFDGMLGWYCADVGLFRPEIRAIKTFKIRYDALATQLSVALGTRATGKFWPARAPFLWKLGEFEFAKKTITAYLVPNVGDQTIFSELSRFLRSPRGNPHATAIVTNDDRDLTPLIIGDGSRIVCLTEFVGLGDKGNLIADREALTRLVLPDQLLRPAQRGRPPTKRSEVQRIIAGLARESGFDGLSERALFERVRDRLQIPHREGTPLGWATFKDALREHRLRFLK